MDAKKLSNLLLIVGAIVIVIAISWWGSFYGQVARELKANLGDALECLFSSGGKCAFVSGIAQMAGVTPYNPTIFWIGLVMLGIGLALRFTAKDEAITQTVSVRSGEDGIDQSGETRYPKEMQELRRIAGTDAVTLAYATEGEWICVCGTHNPLDRNKAVQNCSRCRRNRDHALEQYGRIAAT